MAEWEIWVVIVMLALSTALTRSTFWMLGHKVTMPPRMLEVLRYAPACALAAIIGPDLVLGNGGELQLTVANPKLIAGLAALAFYLWRRNMLLTILVGMLAFTLLRVFHVFGAGA
jgi:branched-subunit amino acid transport protein